MRDWASVGWRCRIQNKSVQLRVTGLDGRPVRWVVSHDGNVAVCQNKAVSAALMEKYRIHQLRGLLADDE